MLLSQAALQNHCILEKKTAGTAYATYMMAGGGAVGHLEMVVSHQTEFQVGQGFVKNNFKFSCIY
jgi:hypothetical protein